MSGDQFVVSTIEDARGALDACRFAEGSVGLVPTMGFLHRGHTSLMAASVSENDLTMATIFVNPLQFAPDEDLDAYPRDLDRDLAMCAEVGVDVVLVPSVEEMYPERMLTTVKVSELGASYEGGSRPTHFDGVATVVAKLFSIAGPCRAYFGEKDFQQLAIVTRMASDLSMPVEVVGCPIVREDDGVAMSSRNHYLSAEQRAAAVVLSVALETGRALVASGETAPAAVRRAMVDAVENEPLAELDYAEVVDPSDLVPPTRIESPVRLLIAARFGPARLLDNMAAAPSGAR